MEGNPQATVPHEVEDRPDIPVVMPGDAANQALGTRHEGAGRGLRVAGTETTQHRHQGVRYRGSPTPEGLAQGGIVAGLHEEHSRPWLGSAGRGGAVDQSHQGVEELLSRPGANAAPAPASSRSRMASATPVSRASRVRSSSTSTPVAACPLVDPAMGQRLQALGAQQLDGGVECAVTQRAHERHYKVVTATTWQYHPRVGHDLSGRATTMPTALITGPAEASEKRSLCDWPAPAGRSSPASATTPAGSASPQRVNASCRSSSTSPTRRTSTLSPPSCPSAWTRWSTTPPSACWARSRPSPPADLRRQFDVNVVGQIAVTQAVLPRLRTAGGRIVFISSTGGRMAVPMEGAYCASKFALEGFADALRVELRPWHIGVSLVEPGPTDTGPWREIQTMIDDMHERMSPAHRDLYSGHTAGLRRVASRLQPRTIPPDAVARVVERALTARRPQARYLAGADAHAMIAMKAVLPTRIGDAIGARISGLR